MGMATLHRDKPHALKGQISYLLKAVRLIVSLDTKIMGRPIVLGCKTYPR